MTPSPVFRSVSSCRGSCQNVARPNCSSPRLFKVFNHSYNQFILLIISGNVDCIEFSLPVRYEPSPADAVNELLFELLSRQLGQLGLREVLLEESDCRQLLENLELQAAAHTSFKEDNNQRG